MHYHRICWDIILGYSIYSSLSEPSDVADEESAAGIAALRSSILDLILDASSSGCRSWLVVVVAICGRNRAGNDIGHVISLYAF